MLLMKSNENACNVSVRAHSADGMKEIHQVNQMQNYFQ